MTTNDRPQDADSRLRGKRPLTDEDRQLIEEHREHVIVRLTGWGGFALDRRNGVLCISQGNDDGEPDTQLFLDPAEVQDLSALDANGVPQVAYLTHHRLVLSPGAAAPVETLEASPALRPGTDDQPMHVRFGETWHAVRGWVTVEPHSLAVVVTDEHVVLMRHDEVLQYI